jgi:hypothetical protein
MKQGFQQDQIMVLTRDGHSFTLMEPMIYVTSLGAVLTIPAGATTDGRSTPAALWSVMPPFGRGWKAWVLHDHLYRRTRMAKTNCDDLMYEAAISLGVDEAEARICLEGVRRGGQPSFDENRAKLDAAEPLP